MFKKLVYPTKWLRLTLLAGLGCLSTVSCKKEAELDMSSGYLVTEAQARMVAENISLSLGVQVQRLHSQQTGDTQRVFQGRQRILAFTAVQAADGQPGFYLCNYAEGGFAIIAADRHMQPILSFAEHGSLPTTDLHNPRVLPEGLISWMETTQAIAVALRENPAEQNSEAGARAGWAAVGDKLTPAPGSSTNNWEAGSSTSNWEAPTHTSTGNGEDTGNASGSGNGGGSGPCTSTQRGPLLRTNWGQGCGYNDLVTASSQSNYCYHCPTGCVATAMAQIMKYWQFPNSFNWAGMPNNTGTPATAQLMEACGRAVDTDYKEGGSSADDDLVDDKLKSWYGYGSADFISNEAPGLYEHVINNIDWGWPVMLGGFSSSSWGFPSGSGHSWVCDGYLRSYCGGYGSVVFHMNWGWNGLNTWSAYNDWRVIDRGGNVHTYNYGKNYILNIHP